MEEKKLHYETVDEYILLYPQEIQDKLQHVRRVIKEEAPEATEKISWKMPTFHLHGNLVHFAAHKSHIGFYPGENGVAQFKDRITEYKSSRGAIQFPYNKQFPEELVRDIVRFRVEENKRIAAERVAKKKEKRLKKEVNNIEGNNGVK